MENPEVSPTQAMVNALVARMANDTARFNSLVTEVPVPAVPTVLSPLRLEWANSAFTEEIVEFNDAVRDGDVLESADSLIDLVFFALGRLGEMGIPALAVWEGVLKANMQKERGELAKRPGSMGHDAVKPADWTPPNHGWLHDFALADVAKARLYDGISPIFKDITALRASKGHDYNNVPGGRDAYFPFGHVSYAHMVNLKALRLQSLVKLGERGMLPNHEGVVDSARDLINYTAFYVEALTTGPLAPVDTGEMA